MNYYFLPILGLAFLLACNSNPEQQFQKHIQEVTQRVTDETLINATGTSGDWITHGLNYYEDRFSGLSQINQNNIDSLGLVWTLELGTRRGIEATPLVADGIMYLTGPWSKVYAVDTRTGEMIWSYNPEVPGRFGPNACCDVVNRGVALYEGSVFVGTIDGRLISLDATTGDPNWQVYTTDTTKYYTITGAPRVVKGKVIIGNGGAEYGVRGYVSAYDAQTGEMDWRFYTVPGNPADPAESPAMQKALETWNGEWWKYGGGGTAWDAMAYDPELNLLYVGTGNGAPWNRLYRSPEGGDNLYLSSILALNPDDGALVWYYQTTPGDTWDYTATQHIILADLNIEGQARKVLMQAPKNGFFYVLDRTTGDLISAKPYVYTNWATHVDLATGRPVETDFSRYENVNAIISPNYDGGHNWQPMAYNPETGLVYIPAMRNSHMYGTNTSWEYGKSGYAASTGWNTGTGFDASKPIRKDSLAADTSVGMLMAWDPIKGESEWLVEHQYRWNAGVLTTAGGLVFQGNAEGKLVAYQAETGTLLWETSVGSGVLAPPVTYLVDGKQYVSVAVGWGGSGGQTSKVTERVYPGIIYTFALGGGASAPEYPDLPPKVLITGDVTVDASDLAAGAELYILNCNRCHGKVGSGGGALPDLAYSSQRIHENFKYIVQGSFEALGMPNFTGKITEAEINLIQQYIFAEAALVAGGN
jgi:quinohemoprotein ethanol dehydrogenase